jgi:hypothetical protein
MKKLFIILGAFVLIAISCSKDDDVDTNYERADLLGKWEQVSPTPESEDCTVYEEMFEFGDELTVYNICDGNETTITFPYEFDGKNITYTFFVFEITMKVIELTGSKLVAEVTVKDVAGISTVTYNKVD